MIKYLSEFQRKVLVRLSVFQYLTANQIVRLRTYKKRNYLYEGMKPLMEGKSPLVKRVDYPVIPGVGKLEGIYYLTKKGAKLLIEHTDLEPEKIKYPKREAVNFERDYFHRVQTVDFFISAQLWAEDNGYSMEDFYYYFQQSSGSNRNNKGGRNLSDNRLDIDRGGVGYIVPDGIGIIERGTEKPVFFLFEQHNGKDRNRFLKQVHGHTLAIEDGAASLKYDVKHNGEHMANRVFCVFENSACMHSARTQLSQSQDFPDFMDFFLFKTHEDLLNTSFGEGWELANGQAVNF